MDDGFRERVVMVAAASKGLGYGLAEAVARRGASVSIASRTATDIQEAAGRLSADYRGEAAGFTMDATDPDSIGRWVAGTLERFGRIDGLVVNAGGPPPGKFDAFDDRDWEAGFQLTLMSAVRMIRAVLPTMRAQGSGSIITVTSSAIKEPIDILLLSNVFRAGVVALVKSLSRDLATTGIRINNLVPGQIATDRVRSNDEFLASKRGTTPEAVAAERHAQIPMGRYGSPREFGEAGAFLLSDDASYVTGATLMVDGGRSRTLW